MSRSGIRVWHACHRGVRLSSSMKLGVCSRNFRGVYSMGLSSVPSTATPFFSNEHGVSMQTQPTQKNHDAPFHCFRHSLHPNLRNHLQLSVWQRLHSNSRYTRSWRHRGNRRSRSRGNTNYSSRDCCLHYNVRRVARYRLPCTACHDSGLSGVTSVSVTLMRSR